eukprot:m.1647681 g.1647681  ORF g.1647681 m.1647681 type:complete len:52 (+) comp75819_c0_seq1:159-314(+)
MRCLCVALTPLLSIKSATMAAAGNRFSVYHRCISATLFYAHSLATQCMVYT